MNPIFFMFNFRRQERLPSTNVVYQNATNAPSQNVDDRIDKYLNKSGGRLTISALREDG